MMLIRLWYYRFRRDPSHNRADRYKRHRYPQRLLFLYRCTAPGPTVKSNLRAEDSEAERLAFPGLIQTQSNSHFHSGIPDDVQSHAQDRPPSLRLPEFLFCHKGKAFQTLVSLPLALSLSVVRIYPDSI